MSDRGINLDSTLCLLCKDYPENREHAFVTCRKVLEVRKAINRWWDILPEQNSDFQEFANAVKLPTKPNNSDLVKGALVDAYFWLIWKGKNDVVFNGRSFNSLVIANEIQSVVYSWVPNRSCLGKSRNWHNWVCNLRHL